MLHNTQNQPTKFRTKIWVEINDDAHGTYNTNSQTRFETLILKPSLCDYSYAYILVKENVNVTAANPNKRKNILIKNCAPFTKCISEINNTQKDKAKYIDTVILMYNLTEYGNNYQKHQEVHGNRI